jgi:hypothetical protein
MKLIVIAAVIAAALLLAPAAQAATGTITGSTATASEIIQWAESGHLPDIVTADQVEQALDIVQRDPAKYGRAEIVLESYLATRGELAYTGVSPVIYVLGLILMGSGLILRRRSATRPRAR